MTGVEDPENTSVVGPTVYEVKRLLAISDNVFLVIAAATVNRIALINRNMVVMRHHKRELTLINPIRLDEQGEKRLLRLGKIQRLIRLAPRHGAMHDKYYLSKFPHVRRWAPAGLNSSKDNNDNHQQLPVHRLFTHDDDAILPACHVYCFQETLEPECALILLSNYVGNLLVTSDALQSHRENMFINMVVRTKLAASGMTAGQVVIPSSWVKKNQMSSTASTTNTLFAPLSVREQRRALRWDFEMLLRLDFDHLVGASGVLLVHKAKEQSVLAVEQAFPLM